MYGKMQEFGLTEIIPFTCISAIWGQHPVFFPHAHLREQLQPGGCWIPVLFFFLSGLEGWNP